MEKLVTWVTEAELNIILKSLSIVIDGDPKGWTGVQARIVYDRLRDRKATK